MTPETYSGGRGEPARNCGFAGGARRGSGQYAPRPLMIANGVLKRIEMSSQIDQFSM